MAVKDDGPDSAYERLDTLVASPAGIVLMKKFSEIFFLQPHSHPAHGTSTGKIPSQPPTPEANPPSLNQPVETAYSCPLH